VIGAGRVGAVLASALRSAGHEIVAAAGESDASRGRIADLLPGVPNDKPTAVARTCDVLLLTVPAHPAMTFTGTGVDLGRLAGCVFGVTADQPERAFTERLVADLGGRSMWVPEDRRTVYHAALAHGANHLVTLVTQAMELLEAAGAENPADTLRPLLSAALDNALDQGDSALTGPIVRGDVETVRGHLAEISRTAPHTLPSYVAMARDTLDRVVTDGRLLPIRAEKMRQVLAQAVVPAPGVSERHLR